MPSTFTPLVADEHFILATRDTGYRSLASAISELIDNAIEAEAKTVHVLVREDKSGRQRSLSMAVLDDGEGMSPERLRCALQFGGSTRFGSREGLGRFGMGLPNSSVSQSRRLDLYSWTAGAPCHHTYLDVDEVASGTKRGVPRPVKRALPSEVSSLAGLTGTAVFWSRCDRIEFRKAVTIREKLHRILGRRYRYLLGSRIELLIDGEPVCPFDPLFLAPTAGVPFQAAKFGEPMVFNVDVPGRETSTLIEAQFSELPIAILTGLPSRRKRELGIVGGSGISFVRAGREIDYGWMLLGSKRKENYDDWWRCELRFQPDADELFGVTHSKQGVNPSQYLKDFISPDLEGVARSLNSRARHTFLGLPRNARAVAAANQADAFLPVPEAQSALPMQSSSFSYCLLVVPLPSREMLVVQATDGVVEIRLNSAHPFYSELYLPLKRLSPLLSDRLDSLIFAGARAHILSDPRTRSDLQEFGSLWSDAAAAFLSHL